MRLADFLWYFFSTGGVVVALVVAAAWLLAASRSRARWLALAIAIGYAAAAIYPIPHAAAAWLVRGFEPLAPGRVAKGRTAIVVLGSGGFTAFDWANNRHGVPDPDGLTRTLEAARIFRMIDAAWVVSSGGPPDAGGQFPPADLMKAALVEIGVPPSRVIVRSDSSDTRSEAQAVARLLPTLDVRQVVLVTSGVHMRRAVGAFRAAGVEVIPAPARGPEPAEVSRRRRWLPSQAGMRETAVVVHEIAGLIYYRLRGWLG